MMIKIRYLTKKDELDDLIHLSKEFFKEYDQHHPDFFKISKIDDNDVKSYFKKTLGRVAEKTVVALDGDKIVAYITFSIKERLPLYQLKRVGHISGLMVDKKYRRLGIAKKLLDFSKDWFKRKGIKYSYLETSSQNHGAIKFYSKNNFQNLRV